MQWAHLGDYFIGCPLISSMPLWIFFANMCPLYLIVQGQQIYVAKLQKANLNQIPPRTADIDQGNMEFSCLRCTIIISRLKLPVFVFGHFSHSIPMLTHRCSFAFTVFCLELIVTSPPVPESSADLSILPPFLHPLFNTPFSELTELSCRQANLPGSFGLPSFSWG